jgi:hypothetical protein
MDEDEKKKDLMEKALGITAPDMYKIIHVVHLSFSIPVDFFIEAYSQKEAKDKLLEQIKDDLFFGKAVEEAVRNDVNQYTILRKRYDIFKAALLSRVTLKDEDIMIVECQEKKGT